MPTIHIHIHISDNRSLCQLPAQQAHHQWQPKLCSSTHLLESLGRLLPSVAPNEKSNGYQQESDPTQCHRLATQQPHTHTPHDAYATQHKQHAIKHRANTLVEVRDR